MIDRKWRIDAELGAGGMGVVYAATDLRLDRKVAIKLLKDELVSSSDVVKRFMREARASVRLKSEHACRVFDVGELPSGAPYMVMELLEGVDLARTIRNRPLSVETAADYIAQACDALAEAHAIGIVHRDFKPANLMLTKGRGGAPFIKVLDFGIATAFPDEMDETLTATHTVIGSPQYMSPEQLATPSDVDARSDVWSIGVTLYQLVSGRFPFAGDNVPALSIAIATQPHRPLTGVPPAFAAVVDRCLAKLPGDRFANAAHVASKLRSLVDLVPHTEPAVAQLAETLPSEPGARPSVPLPSVATGPGRGRRTPIAIAAAAVVVAAAVATVLLVRRTDHAPAPRFTKVDLSHYANHPLDSFVDAPVGEVYLGGVPFDLLGGDAAVVHTHADNRDDLPRHVEIPVASVTARSAHALIAGVWLNEAKQDQIGTLRYHHVNGSEEPVALVRRSTIREGWLPDEEMYDMKLVPPPPGVTWQNVRFAPRGKTPHAHQFLDMLSATVDPSPIDRITLDCSDPLAGITLIAVTLEAP
ncbi:MAG: serine/threonine protein kinase [Deltaproteobacteria bacterium]|nr:serine/threonine protein kinase [Deltaproteobacteria bacterium]